MTMASAEEEVHFPVELHYVNVMGDAAPIRVDRIWNVRVGARLRVVAIEIDKTTWFFASELRAFDEAGRRFLAALRAADKLAGDAVVAP